MQDIAGCRILVAELAEQDRVTAALTNLFVRSTVVDRRQKPSHGYRAVHVVVTIDQRTVEVQVRTALQQAWAELSEKLSDLLGSSVKYGGGDGKLQKALLGSSEASARFESREYELLKTQRTLANRLTEATLTEGERAAIMASQAKTISRLANLRAVRDEVLNDFRKAVHEL